MGAGVTACVTIFWLKYNFTIWKMPEKLLYDSQPNATAFNLLHLFTQPALAEDDADAPEVMTPLEPEYDPALVPEATQVMDDVSMRTTRIQYVDLDGTTFAFYIATTGDGRDRLTWRNLATGQTGNVQAALQEIADAEVQEDEYRVVDKIDYAFDVQGETFRENVDLPPTVLAAVLCTSSLADETFETDGQTVTVKAPTDSCAYYLMLASDGKGGLYNPFFDKEFPQFPALGHKMKHGFVSVALEFACGEIELTNYDLSAVAAQGTIQLYTTVIHSAAREYISHNADAGMDTGRIVNAYIYTALPDFFNNQSVTTALNDSIPLLDGNGVRFQCRSGFPAGVLSKCSTWYALEKAGDDAPGTLVHGMDLASGGDRLTAIQGFDDDVVFYRNVLQSYDRYDHTDDVFYLARTTDDSGEHHWLKRAGVTSQTNYDDTGCYTSAYTVTDYDVEIRAGSFYAQKVNGVIYVYWLATAQKEKETDPEVYRIKSVVYDPISDAMRNEMVLAEFSMPDADLTPASLFLSESGTGYCTAVVGSGDDLRSDVYSFPVNWITSLELNAMTLSDTHTNPASWLDTVVSVMNSGNTGISAFDLELYVVQDDGTETVVEKHCDCLNPENNAIYEGGKMVSNGDHTIIRLEDAVQPFQQTDHNVSRKRWTRDGGDERQPDEYFDSTMLLPGAVKSYSMPIYIPVDWDGYKTLLLRVSMNAIRANWLAANTTSGMATNDLKPARDAEAKPEIVYTHAADGTMVRSDNAAQNGALMKSAASGFAPNYPDAVKATRSLALNNDIHDLKVAHRVYRDANGEDYIAITFLNHTDTGRALEMDAYIYMDDDEEPFALELPYYPDRTADSYTHTDTLRLDALLGGRHPRNASVVIEPYGIEETALRNNQFTLHFSDEDVDDPLRLVEQPSSVAAQVGETVTFTVTAEGGVKPYTYRWQVWMDEKKGWKDIPDSDSPTLTVENVTAEMHGRKAHCVVTDHCLNHIVSEAATLIIPGKLPETGDDTNLPLYIAVALLALAALWWIRRREKRT